MTTYEKMLHPEVVAEALGLDVKTLARWVQQGVIECVTLPTGHRRYAKSVLDSILAGTYVMPRDRVDQAEEL